MPYLGPPTLKGFVEDQNELSCVCIDLNHAFFSRAVDNALSSKEMARSALQRDSLQDAVFNVLSLQARIQEGLEDARVHSSLGIAYAGLGLKEEAIREGTLAVELLPVTKEAIGGVFRVRDLAVIYTKIGEFDAAIDQIEYLLSVPSDMSVPRLRLDPTWDPLRGHPRFQKLVEADR